MQVLCTLCKVIKYSLLEEVDLRLLLQRLLLCSNGLDKKGHA